jgi:hypothetical protein
MEFSPSDETTRDWNIASFAVHHISLWSGESKD